VGASLSYSIIEEYVSKIRMLPLLAKTEEYVSKIRMLPLLAKIKE
jgi:hypothetical protein